MTDETAAPSVDLRVRSYRALLYALAVFGFLPDYETAANVALAVVSLAAAVGILCWSRQRSTAGDPALFAALGLILAGALGNLYDRLFFIGVRDFLHWNCRYDWPVFNV